jgi:hypothetical protein
MSSPATDTDNLVAAKLAALDDEIGRLRELVEEVRRNRESRGRVTGWRGPPARCASPDGAPTLVAAAHGLKAKRCSRRSRSCNARA